MHIPIKNNLVLSLHAHSRLKTRLGLKTKKKRNSFIQSASTHALYSIPEGEEWMDFKNYFKSIKRRIKSKNPYCEPYLYKDYILVVSDNHIVVTIYSIDPIYKGSYNKIRNTKNN